MGTLLQSHIFHRTKGHHQNLTKGHHQYLSKIAPTGTTYQNLSKGHQNLTKSLVLTKPICICLKAFVDLFQSVFFCICFKVFFVFVRTLRKWILRIPWCPTLTGWPAGKSNNSLPVSLKNQKYANFI